MLSLTLSGCYYTQLARGQMELLKARRPIAEVLRDPATPPDVVAALELVAATREYAQEIGLEVEGQYESYAAWPGERMLTTIVRTRPGELVAYPFWFPLIGDAPYKGYFKEEDAKRAAEKLRSDGFDVCVSPVRAYSTLGWFDDPLTEPMLRLPPGQLTEVILHELVHTTVFAPGEPDFNEGLATFVGQEAAVRFRERRDEGERARLEVTESRMMSYVMANFRRGITRLYAEQPAGSDRDLQRRKFEGDLLEIITTLDLETVDTERYAEQVRLNDACLVLGGTYEADIPRYEARLADLGGDLEALLTAARAAADAADPRAALFAADAENP